MEHRGSCLCGQVTYTVTGAFEHFMFCHCTRCQKGSGSVHGANLFAPGAHLEWTGEGEVRTYQVPNTRHSRSFCVRCGSAVPTLAMAGKLVVVPAGSLDTRLDKAPDAHIFCGDQASWEGLLTDLPRFDTLPKM